ncbi:hypothetical protein [Bradyrhizobium ottawaense]|uniref:hypothetical protein n=1 Tax=Bradyrhizobium ottawaense TaxID=931866 RepID=UPI001178BB27|nr:hypothetical protein [Bradyrhizobium ottawaense]
MDERLKKFLGLVPTANWRSPPPVWNEQLREALSEGYVEVAFGGRLQLTPRAALHLRTEDLGQQVGK